MDKRDHMKFISEKFGVEFDDIVFVEDNLEQLLTVNGMGVKLVLAGWGYNTEEQKREAAELGIPVVTPETFEMIVVQI